MSCDVEECLTSVLTTANDVVVDVVVADVVDDVRNEELFASMSFSPELQ